MSPEQTLDALPLVAILRGVTPDRVVAVGEILFSAGIRVLEVPLNSPDPFQSISRMAQAFAGRCLYGSGTVTSINDVDRAAGAGAALIVAPNSDAGVIAHAVAKGLTVMPGFMTASEAFTAIKAGATRLKLFPASSCGTGHLQALKAILPANVNVYAVGGVSAEEFPAWRSAGAAGFGIGSELFKPGFTDDEIAVRAQKLVQAMRSSASKT